MVYNYNKIKLFSVSQTLLPIIISGKKNLSSLAFQIIHKHRQVYNAAKIQMPESVFENLNHAKGLQHPTTTTLSNAIISSLETF